MNFSSSSCDIENKDLVLLLVLVVMVNLVFVCFKLVFFTNMNEITFKKNVD